MVKHAGSTAPADSDTQKHAGKATVRPPDPAASDRYSRISPNPSFRTE